MSKYETIWQNIKNGDSKAFAALFDSFWNQLYQSAYWRVADEDTAKDIVQDVFINLWNKRESIEIESQIEAYLLQSVRNKVIDHFRAIARKAKHEASLSQIQVNDSGNATEEHIYFKELEVAYQNALSSLPNQMQEVYRLNKEQGFSIDQIAAALHIKTQTVKNQLGTAKQRLRAELLQKVELRNQSVDAKDIIKMVGIIYFLSSL